MFVLEIENLERDRNSDRNCFLQVEKDYITS